VSKTPSYTTAYQYNLKQDSQCTYNITLGRVRATVDAVEKQ